MSNAIKSDKSVKVISDAREEEILSIFRTLHGKVLTALQECDIKPTFNTEWDKCGTADYKDLHQASRTLLSAKVRDRNDKRVAGVRTKIQGVVDTYMSQARAAKAAMEAMPADVRKFLPAFSSTVRIPLSDIRACFPQGATDSQVFADLEYMSYKVTQMNEKGEVLVPFVKAEEKSDKVAEEAPKSGEAVKAA